MLCLQPAAPGRRRQLARPQRLSREELVRRVVDLVKQHRPMHVSLVGGEPLVRRKELDQILPQLSQLGVFTLVVTSAVAPIPAAWMEIPRLRVTVSVDGLPEHHDIRRKPATYERILKNIAGREVNIHLTITRPMVHSAGYLEEYFAFWGARPEINHIWVSTYTPQVGEETCEMLTRNDRAALFERMPNWQRAFPASGETCGLRFFQNVRQLLGGLEHPGGALHPGRSAGLQPVRMRRQRRLPFPAPYRPARTAESGALDRRFGRNRRHGRPRASFYRTGAVAEARGGEKRIGAAPRAVDDGRGRLFAGEGNGEIRRSPLATEKDEIRQAG
jgi:hypothetical protein